MPAMKHVTALVLLVALAAPAGATPVTSVGAPELPPAPPYLQNGQVGAMTLVWRERSATPATVAWWPQDGGARRQAESVAPYQHEVALDGLAPGRRYRWEVRQGAARWEGGFRANRPADADHVRFAVVGDLGSGAKAEWDVVRGIRAYEPEFVVAPGDIVYQHGGWDEYGPHFFAPYGPLLAEVPFYPALGNHDVRTEDGAPYLQAFALPAEPGGERYYTFRSGPAQFFALDSTRSLRPGSQQHQWLAREGEASTARWKIAFFHHPAFSSGLHGSHGPIQRDLPPLFTRLGFDLVLTGHDHHYERTVPIGGVTYLVSGGGGGMLYRAQGAAWTAATRTEHHFVGVQIAGDTLALRAIGADGRVIDAHAIAAKR